MVTLIYDLVASCDLSSRPYGGCTTFWPANLKASIHFVDTCNRRISSVRLCNDDHFIDDYKLLFMNVYMPHESDNDAYNKYHAVLADVISVADLFPDLSLVIDGDFNVDLSKLKLHSQLLIDACTDNNLRIATLHECYDIDFTYNFCMNRFSFIDHFIVSTAMYATSIAGCTVGYDGDNLSNHDPIINIEQNSIALTKRNTVARAAWDRASHRDIAEYKYKLQDKLNSVLPPSE